MAKIIQEEWKIQVPFHLDYTLQCGQAFRWKRFQDRWVGFIKDFLVEVQYDPQTHWMKIRAKPVNSNAVFSREQIEEYFGLKDSLSMIKETTIAKLRENGYAWFIPKMEEMFQKSAGLRILRQELWEVSLSYLLSTQTSIPAIETKLHRLCGLFSENELEWEGESFFRFPSHSQLSSIKTEVYQSLGFGYRSGWVYQFVQQYVSSEFQALKTESLERKVAFLLRFSGIGYKVAHCICLFGFSEMGAFPVDVWISRWLNEVFSVKGNSDTLTHVGQKMFGRYAGYVQEYIFNYCRNLKPGGGWI